MSRSPIEPGTVLLHYRLIERLGAGGMGVVWKALDTTLGREVAIKILPVALASDPERIARFEREAKLLASLNHPNVAAVYGLHEANGVRFLAMELVRGGTLRDELQAGLTPARVVELAGAIADGLAAAHRQHVIHRDLKPENIVIDSDGRPKILDFGLAKLAPLAPNPDAPTMAVASDATGAFGEAATREGTLLGTVAYMSPEQAEGRPVDARSDVFSLGIVLYEMATGRRPFTGANPISILSSILRDTPPSLMKLVPTTAPQLDRVVRRCLEKDPAARYADASGVREDLLALRAAVAGKPSRVPRGVKFAAAAAATIVLVLAGGWLYRKQERANWLRKDALPQLASITGRIQSLEEGRESWDAFQLARRIDAVAPDDPLVEQLRQKFAREVSITSEPPGATVSVRYYDEPDGEPVILGKTPMKGSFPRGFSRLRLELPGHVPVDDVIWNIGLIGSEWNYRLYPLGEIPAEMAFVPSGKFDLFIPGLDHNRGQSLSAFLMDRAEVTNREYKRFVDAGGYTNRKYWQQPFSEGTRELSWEEAMRLFVDRTGRPGPATWEVGAPPEGHDDHPVSGVSWFEAAAYAEWAGKSLPTIFHWNRVAFTPASSHIIPLANLSGSALMPAGRTKSTNRFGVSELAGNVREWIWNATDRGRSRYILGGGWTDPDWSFSDAYAQPPFDRSVTNGFRCIRYVENEPSLTALQRPLERSFRDFRTEKPVPDAVFNQYLQQFRYDRGPLEAKIEEEKRTPSGVRQKITFAAAYGGERMAAYLFLPATGRAPYQVVIVFPGSGAIEVRSSANLDPGRVDFLQKTGRAVLWPIYKGTYERGSALRSDHPEQTSLWKDHVIMWAKDMARSIDYIETRKDLDATRIGYFGLSWGGAMGAILPAVEPRIKANVLYVAGMLFQRAYPEVDQINYVTRVRQPTLILNGELDFFFTSETSQKPLFELLGSPPDQKKRLVFPGGHSVPRTETARESLLWFDRYLGPV